MEQQNQSITTETSAESTGMTPNNAPAPRKSHKALYISLIIFALIAIGVGAWFFLTSQKNTNNEEMAYEILEGNDNPQDYEDYLANFPEGKHASEVRDRLEKLQAMIAQWNSLQTSENVSDFVKFKNTYNDAQYSRLCDIKIDSLDFVSAQNEGTEEAFKRYLALHPDGRYASEASVAQGEIRDAEISVEERDQVMHVISDFFKGFESQDEALICSNITSKMTSFLSQKNATKAQVLSTIKNMFSEHIQSCQFQVNRDVDITRSAAKNSSTAVSGFHVTFTVDQHIQRDNEGKTFGSYKCTAEVTPQLLISSLIMEEVSRQ